MIETPSRLLRIPEVAQRLNVSRGTASESVAEARRTDREPAVKPQAHGAEAA